MFLYGIAKDGDVIEVDRNVVQVAEDTVHHKLKVLWCIGGAERHHQPLVQNVIKAEGHLGPVRWADWNMPVPIFQIKRSDELFALESM